MKKSIFFLTALFVATCTNAQITKVWTGPVDMFGSNVQVMEPTRESIIGNYLAAYRNVDTENCHFDIMDASSLSLVKSFWLLGSENDWFNLQDENVYEYNFLSKGIFSTDDKWACIAYVGTKEEYVCGECGAWSGSTITKWTITEIQVINEDGAVLAKIPYYMVHDDMYVSAWGTKPKLVKTGNSFKLFVPKTSESNDYTNEYDVYSLPGDASSQDLISILPSSNNISARKYLHNDKVLIDSNERTYTLTGQEVR